jgi:hypothetical protein
MSQTPDIIKILVINCGSDPIETEKFELPVKDRDLAKDKVLTIMNKMGKNSEAIVGFGGNLFLYSHTAARGPSKKLYNQPITYHPLSAQVR